MVADIATLPMSSVMAARVAAVAATTPERVSITPLRAAMAAKGGLSLSRSIRALVTRATPRRVCMYQARVARAGRAEPTMSAAKMPVMAAMAAMAVPCPLPTGRRSRRRERIVTVSGCKAWAVVAALVGMRPGCFMALAAAAVLAVSAAVFPSAIPARSRPAAPSRSSRKALVALPVRAVAVAAGSAGRAAAAAMAAMLARW